MIPETGSAKERALAFALLVLVLAGGAFVRLVDLGSEPLFEDDLNHITVARAVEAGDPPALPSGVEYTRAFDFTRMVGAALRAVPGVERAARVPAALFGVLGLVLMAAIGWRLAGPWAAFWATLLLALFPDAVAESRRVRFYTYQMAWLLVALFAVWKVVERAGERSSAVGGQPDRTLAQAWLWAAAAAVAFAAAYRVQLTTVTLVGTAAVVVALAAAADLHALGRRAWRRSAPLQLTALGAAGFVGLGLAAPHVPVHLLDVALCRGCEAAAGDPRTYYWDISSAYPLLVSLSPLVFLAVGLRRPRLALFLLVWFALPFILHSFVFPRRAMRFLLGPLPALFLAAGIAAAMGAGLLRRAVRERLERGGRGLPRIAQRRADLLATGAVAVIAVAAIVTTPAFNESRKVPSLHLLMDWEAAGAVIREADPEGLIPVGSGYTMQPLHYWNRLDFSVATDFLVRSIEGDPPESGRPPGVGWTTLEPYTGRPLLTRPEEIRAAYPDAQVVLISVDENKWVYGDITSALRETLELEAIELCRGRCAGLMVFLWRLHDPRGPADTHVGRPQHAAPR